MTTKERNRPPAKFVVAGTVLAGEQTAGDPGLYYLRARYYDPEIGRFLTRDPLQGQPCAPQTLNAYAYALNNPTNRVDPTGLASESADWQDAFIEELLFQECLKLTALSIAIAILAVGFLALPAFVGASGAAGVLLAGISTVNFLATAGASAGIGYAAYELCSHRVEQLTP